MQHNFLIFLDKFLLSVYYKYVIQNLSTLKGHVMRNKARITALVLACAMLFSGCNNSPADTSSADNSSNVSITQSSTENSESSDEGSSKEESSSEAEKPESSEAETSSSESQTESSDAETSAPESTKAPETEKPAPNSDFSASWTLSNTWQDGGNYCGGYEVVVTNNSGKQVESWTVTVTVPDGFEIISGWNAQYKVNGSTLTVTNESYNGSVANGGTVSFGFNYSSPSEFTPKDVKFNGSSTPIVDAPDNNGNNNTQTTTTTKPVETVPPAPVDPDGSTPVSVHGQLSVKGSQLVDKNGNAYQLKGMSTHGIGWFPAFVNEGAFRTLRDDWNTNVVRLAMYTGASEGYTGSAMLQHEALVRKGINICIALDMYVIVDWHVLADQSPSVRKKDAIRFFDEISKEYADCPNIIYEICNEPNGYSQWDNDIKPYAEEVIPVIRKNDPDSVIIVGTPTWSQDIDKAMNNPLPFDNVMYALHFYAATHTDWLRQRAENCANNGLPIFVSEFGCCDASGNGGNNFQQTKEWLSLLDRLGISYCNWNLANKNESSSAFKESTHPNGNWTESEMNEGAIWIRKWFRGEIQ